MHPEIAAVLKNMDDEDNFPNYITIANAEILLHYIEDINIHRNNRFELTPADSLYLLWQVGQWEIHMECLKNGKILYTFRKSGYCKATGTAFVGQFIKLLEKYLLTGIC